MAKVISDNQALNVGCDLWLLADLSHSKWSRQLDWYLNFQIIKAESYQKQHLSAEVLAIASKWEYDVPTINDAKAAPLSIASGKLLPNLNTVFIQYTSSADFAKSCKKVFTSLGRPSTRVFLPDASGFSQSEFNKIWGNDEIEVVSELKQ